MPHQPNRLLRSVAAALVASALSACAVVPAVQPGPATAESPRPPAAPPAPSEVRAWQGHMALRLEALGPQSAKGLSLTFAFTGSAQQGHLDLMTPLGSMLAQVRWSPQGAWLLRDGTGSQVEAHASLDALMQQVLGEPVPLRSLMHWLDGQPDPEHAHRERPPAELGRPGFEQLGWEIDTSQLSQQLLRAHRPAHGPSRGVHITLRLDP